MPIHYRNPTTVYTEANFQRLRNAVGDAEFMMAAFRRGQLSDETFPRFAREYRRRWSNSTLAEIFSEDVAVQAEAEELVGRNETVLEQLDAIDRATCVLSPSLSRELSSRLSAIDEAVNTRLQDEHLAVYFPLPSLE